MEIPDNILFHDRDIPKSPYAILEKEFIPNCCNRPFTSYNVLSYKLKCLNCKKEYRIKRKYKCAECSFTDDKLNHLNLVKDNRSDWCKCNGCNAIFTIEKIINITETEYYN
jgi:hypothetical protein